MQVTKKLFKIIGLLLIFLSCGLASGCSNRIKDKLGLLSRSPDEFTVVSNPKLDIPTTFELVKPGLRKREKKGAMQNSTVGAKLSGEEKAFLDYHHDLSERERQARVQK